MTRVLQGSVYALPESGFSTVYSKLHTAPNFQPMHRVLRNHPHEVLRFIHITDTHLLSRADETFYGLNTKSSLQVVLSDCAACYPEIDFWLFTGDISQTGTKESYALFSSAIQQYDIPVYCVPGNHDTPEFLRHVVPDSPVNSVNIIQFGRFSMVLLDSWIENEHHGRISRSCLRQLEEYLQDSDQFNIIVLHHPPVEVNSQWLDEIGLDNRTEFLQVLGKCNAEMLVLFGHVHQEVDRQSDKLRMLSTPSTCHQFKPHTRSHHTDSLPPAYRFVKLGRSEHIDTRVHYVSQAHHQK